MKKKLLLILSISLLIVLVFASFKSRQKQKVHFNHLAVFVYDLKVSTNFYQNILRLDTIPNPFNDGRHTWFNIGDHSQLHLIAGNKKEQQHDKDTHLCLSVSSTDEFVKQLQATHTNFSNWKGDGQTPTLRADGVKQIYLQDPDGYWVEINDDKY
jgi:lactoylglutathione lyase